MSINVRDLILSSYSEPTFSANFHQIARPQSDHNDSADAQIYKHISTICWRVNESDDLEKIQTLNRGIFFDSESYVIQWLFALKIDNTIVEELLLYYWKGERASKKYSPLPPDIEEHCPVERMVQWSEPAIFFQSFPTPVFAFKGRSSKFDHHSPHLLIGLGELQREMHFYEVPCAKYSLRSRAVFLLILPKEKRFIYWYGRQVTSNHRHNVDALQAHEILMKWQNFWSDFAVEQMEERHTSELFFEVLEGDIKDYNSFRGVFKYSPKLFYLNSITGAFLATEIEYPLRTKSCDVWAFPFLQSHLYSAPSSALFLVDNGAEVWLWKGRKEENNDPSADEEEELKLGIQLLKEYAQTKGEIIDTEVVTYQTSAGNEPASFKNIFPFWDSSV